MARKSKRGGSSGNQQTGSDKRGKTPSGAKKNAHRPGPSGTGKKSGIQNSSSKRRSGSRSGGGQGSKGKAKDR